MTDERELVNRAQNGDPEAFRSLVNAARVNVFRLAYNLVGNQSDAEDLSQEVFIKAYRSLSKFRGEAKWSSWLYRITVNLCYDHNKSRSRKQMKYRGDIAQNEIQPAVATVQRPITPDRTTESNLIQRHIEEALSQLTPRERSIFVLRHYHDLQLKQIANTLEVSEGTVKTLLFRAIRKLQQELSFYKHELGIEG